MLQKREKLWENHRKKKLNGKMSKKKRKEMSKNFQKQKKNNTFWSVSFE